MAYTLPVALQLGSWQTGIADLRAQIVDLAGADVGAAQLAYVEIGSGAYLFTMTMPDGHTGGIKFYSDAVPATSLAFVSISPQEYENADVKTSSISTPVINVAAIAAAVWSYAVRTLTQSAAQVAAAVQGSDLILLRGDTFVANLTGLGSLVGRDKLWFSIKDSRSDTDEEAIIQIVEGVGLVRLNGAAATATDGSLVVTDASLGDVTITIEATATQYLVPKKRRDYDIQMLDGIVVTTKTEGICTIRADVTRDVD